MHRQMNKRRIVLLTPLLLGASMATAHGRACLGNSSLQQLRIVRC